MTGDLFIYFFHCPSVLSDINFTSLKAHHGRELVYWISKAFCFAFFSNYHERAFYIAMECYERIESVGQKCCLINVSVSDWGNFFSVYRSLMERTGEGCNFLKVWTFVRKKGSANSGNFTQKIKILNIFEMFIIFLRIYFST